MPKKSDARTRIMIVDDHPLVRDGLAALVSAEPDLEVCCAADSIRTAQALLPQCRPDLLIVDLSLKDGLGLDLLRWAKAYHPQLPLLVVSACDEQMYAERALRCGALGFVNKQECDTTLLQAIRTVLAGQRHVSEDVLHRLFTRAIDGEEPPVDNPVQRLTDREFEIFRLIGRGVKTGQIAEQLFISPHTVESHREKIRHKLALKNGQELQQHAMRWVIDHEP